MRFFILLLFLSGFIHAQDTDRFASEIEAFEEADKVAPVDPGVIVFTGSSSVRMWKSVNEDFPDHRIINRGFGGSQFSDLIHYADRLIYAYRPEAVFVYEGDNDINAGDTPKQVLKQAKKLRKMIRKELGRETPVVFISPKPSVSRWELREEYEDANARLKAYADKTDHTYYVDVWTPALKEDGMVREDIFLQDNLHMNDKGYAIWVEAIGPMLDRLASE